METLPAELKLLIFTHLATYTDVLSLSQTSSNLRAFYELNKETVLTRLLSSYTHLNNLLNLLATPHYNALNVERARFWHRSTKNSRIDWHDPLHPPHPGVSDPKLLGVLLRIETMQRLLARTLASYEFEDISSHYPPLPGSRIQAFPSWKPPKSYTAEQWLSSIYATLILARSRETASGRPGPLRARLLQIPQEMSVLLPRYGRPPFLRVKAPGHSSYADVLDVRNNVTSRPGIDREQRFDNTGLCGQREAHDMQWKLQTLVNKAVEYEFHSGECGCERWWGVPWKGDREMMYRIMREVVEWGQEGELEIYQFVTPVSL